MESYGTLLRSTREQKNLDYETVERETTLTRQYLIALEEEDAAAFPGEPYLVGFLRTYAEYLGLESEELIKLYHAKKIQESPVPPGLLERNRPKFLIPLIVVASTLFVVGLGLYLYFGLFKVPQRLAEKAQLAQESTKAHQYTFDGQTQTRRLYKGDQILVPSTNDEDGYIILTIGSTLGSLAVETPAGRQMFDLSEERDLDVDGDGIKDLILYLSDISATDESRGAEVRMLLRDESYSALVASTTQEPDSVEDVAATQKPATVIVRGVQPTQFTLNISFRGPCLLRYQSDGVTDENYYQSGDVLNITATRGNPIRLWISNHNALKIQVVADARTYDLDLGRAGEVMVEEIRWLRDSSGSRLVVLELD